MKMQWLAGGSMMVLAMACGGSNDGATDPSPDPAAASEESPATSTAPSPAGGGDGQPGASPSAPAPQPAPPVITAVAPVDGAVGVDLTPTVKVTFSRPMDRPSTEAAFKLGGANGAFAWSDADKVLEFTPASPLGNGLDAIVGVERTAKDKEGVALGKPFASTFRTLRKTTVDLASKTIIQCSSTGFSLYIGQFHVGDDLQNKEYRAFATFDLAALPEDLTSIDHAKLTLSNGTVVAPLAGVAAESMSLGQNVDCNTDFSASARTFLNPFTKAVVPERLTFEDKGAGSYVGDATFMTNLDWADRAALGKRVMVRIQSSEELLANATAEGIKFDGANLATRPHLSVTYQHP